METGTHDLTSELLRMREGSLEAQDRVLSLLYPEMKIVARTLMRRERPDHTLSPTALVAEAYLAIVKQPLEFQNRQHFLAVAGVAMRRFLIDHSRSFRASKRGGGEHVRVEYVDADSPVEDSLVQILAIDEALSKLEKVDPQAARIVELKYFAGLTNEEAANVLGLSARTVKRDWSFARAWLLSELHTE